MAKQKEIDLRSIMNGDIEAFRTLFECFYVPLREFAANYISSEDVAADIAQETLVKYWERRENFDNIYKVKSFLYNTARNAVLNELAHRKVVSSYNRRMAEVHDKLPAQERDKEVFKSEYYVIRSEVIRRLRAEIEALPKRMRQIMEMALTGTRNEDIAARLNIERETVRSLKKTAHKKLRVKLYDYIKLLSDYRDDMLS